MNARKDIGEVIGGRYEIKEVITHRDRKVSVYVATDVQTQEEVALKLNTAEHRVRLETEFYDDSIRDLEGFPSKRWSWEHGFYCLGAIALDRLGPSLDTLIKEVEESKFSLKTTLQIMDQVITRIQALHERHILHRGVKPDNFCIGLKGSKTENKVYMIDFDHCKKYIVDGVHIRDYGGAMGNQDWTSLAVDEGCEPVRRDDMESAGFLSIYLLKGSLPWLCEYSSSAVRRGKAITALQELCKDLPEEIITYIAYCRSLQFAQEPDYGYCRKLFRQVFEREGFKDDGLCDWSTLELVTESEGIENVHGSDNDFPSSNHSEEEDGSATPFDDDTVDGQTLVADHTKTTEACPQYLGMICGPARSSELYVW
ncbi:serine/threonine protein kinase [Cryptococcus wingfieldii CBS 7118]|uniref:Serine/threonine protein kinase n=1 Tax=Cryptococcus wingfieldii CBS 7118 TaxID=1295528 RepID=A0A1E3JPG3_9TREE|nr:serine/threonine protein kinase [Cryptococcus wingfieldii CBS 7118]ODO01802.1 serine/threonine protein kinase [Cryptococcus wingfieldii CBS 7118]